MAKASRDPNWALRTLVTGHDDDVGCDWSEDTERHESQLVFAEVCGVKGCQVCDNEEEEDTDVKS